MKHVHIPTIEELMASESDFNIFEIEDGYRIAGVRYLDRGRICDLAKELLPPTTQTLHAQNTAQAKPNKYTAACAPVIHAMCKTLYQNRDGKHKELIEKVREFLQKTFNGTLIHTLSQAVYNPGNHDFIAHEVGNSGEYRPGADWKVGPKGLIKDLDTSGFACNQILGEKDPQEANNIYKWITGKDTYLWRQEERPEHIEMYAIKMGNKADYFGITTGALISSNEPTFGIRLERKT